MDAQALSTPFLGGVLIGSAASLLLWTNGRSAGVSGWIAGALRHEPSESAFRYFALLGLFMAGVVAMIVAPDRLTAPARSLPLLALAGLLIGMGSRIGSGCTSGHGVCGVSRASRRSIVATATFVATGVLTVLSARALGFVR